MNDNLKQFFSLIENQFIYGGQKYAHSDTRESTDILFDDFGGDWLYGTIAKYTKRFSNLARERDLLKISCYIFLLWLKRGFHLLDTGTDGPINTTVELKSKYFSKFKQRVKEYKTNDNFAVKNPLKLIYDSLHGFVSTPFGQIKEEYLLFIFELAYYIWNREIKNKGTDKDTYNEKGGKNE